MRKLRVKEYALDMIINGLSLIPFIGKGRPGHPLTLSWIPDKDDHPVDRNELSRGYRQATCANASWDDCHQQASALPEVDDAVRYNQSKPVKLVENALIPRILCKREIWAINVNSLKKNNYDR